MEAGDAPIERMEADDAPLIENIAATAPPLTLGKRGAEDKAEKENDKTVNVNGVSYIAGGTQWDGIQGVNDSKSEEDDIEENSIKRDVVEVNDEEETSQTQPHISNCFTNTVIISLSLANFLSFPDLSISRLSLIIFP